MAKKIFISYSWDDEEHEKWVAQLANDLRSKYGFDAICDTICNASKLNDMMVDGITKSDKVIVVITPNYTNRAENRMGGVGKETGLLFDRYFDNDVVPIIKEKASLPAYLKSVQYIDFTVGNYDDNLNKLAKRLNDETTYAAAAISKTPMQPEDYDIIPDLRINDPKEEDKFLDETFNGVCSRLDTLLKETKTKYQSFHYEKTEKVDTIRSSWISRFEDGKATCSNQCRVVSYEVANNGKSYSVLLWLDNSGVCGFGKGIFGLWNTNFSKYCDYHSHNFHACVNRSGRRLGLSSYGLIFQENIDNENQMGECIYKELINRLK